MGKQSRFALYGLLGALASFSSFSAYCQSNWQPAWASAPQAPFTQGISHDGFAEQTLRMVVHPNQVGEKLRLHFSNRFGHSPVTFAQVSVARQATGAAVINNTLHPVTFNHGQTSITVLPGAQAISDSINEPIQANENLVVSVYIKQKAQDLCWHQDAVQTNYIASGDQSKSVDGKVFTKTITSWFWLDGVDVLSEDKTAGTVITFGDSITDGHRSSVDSNHRWPDYLNQRLSANQSHHFVVLNEGISGNRILQDTEKFGISALARLDEDVLSQSNVHSVIFLEGINDIGHGNYHPQTIINGIEQVAEQLHAHNIKLLVGTLLPFKGAKYDTPEGQKTRDAVNHWIRTSKDIDGVVDFAKAMQTAGDPAQLAAKYDSGDHLHPNDAGYKFMASLVNASSL
ncbi:SGNH/GDSL hydrolase family protein [Celerinatantimonas sp. MCCC 1A17872]|uniref:SGNH/GDSL hydrolase family protein n=1 Tax=Celerinatantimonas sp. MCCC 1A17872 TaxID=3177514 RepID=UPI0038C465EC